MVYYKVMVWAALAACTFFYGCRFSLSAEKLDATGEPLIDGPTFNIESGKTDGKNSNGPERPTERETVGTP